MANWFTRQTQRASSAISNTYTSAKNSVVAFKDDVVDKTKHAINSTANVVINPIMSWKVKREVSNGVTDALEKQVENAVAEKTGLDKDSITGSVGIPVARQAAVQMDAAPSWSQTINWGKTVGSTVVETLKNDGYSNKQELQEAVKRNVLKQMQKTMSQTEGFVLAQPDLVKLATEVSAKVADSYDKLPTSVKAEAARRARLDPPAAAEAPKTVAKANGRGEGMLGQLAPPTVGKGNGQAISMG